MFDLTQNKNRIPSAWLMIVAFVAAMTVVLYASSAAKAQGSPTVIVKENSAEQPPQKALDENPQKGDQAAAKKEDMLDTKEKDNVELTSIIWQLLEAYPECGDEFTSAISALIIASPKSAEQVIKTMNKEGVEEEKEKIVQACHERSIGEALAKAVVQLNQTDPEAASHITGLIALSGNQNLQTAFVSGTGDQVAATNDGGGGGQAGGAGQQTGSTGGGGSGGSGTGGGFPSSSGGGGNGVSTSN